ncbi:MAG: glycosyltransferase family 9 protein, partial [Candidatus Omnitrophica bacterium]|nr:glycosyltransferase family 9 protein [Candidatus Omnitrophota bacterium]
CCNSNFIDIVGETDLSQLIGVINNCRILITNDGGPLHIAVAAGIKSVSIFGPVDENVYGPYPASSKHIVIKNTVACRPCYRNFKFSICQIDRKCLDAITVDEVFDATRRLM